MFEKLKKRWHVTSNVPVTKILVVFALTGSTSEKVTGQLLKLSPVLAGLEPIYFYSIYVIATLILYQFILLFFGWLFGEKEFFILFLKKFFKRRRS